MGAPENEYDSEAEMTTDRVGEAERGSSNRRVSKDQVISIVASVWKEMFDLSDEELIQRHGTVESIAARITQ